MLEFQDILDLVNTLDMEFEPLREDARRRYDLYRLRRDPYVPEDIAREGKFRVNSALIIDAAKTIRADLMMNPTEFSVIPLARERDGAIPRAMERRAENLERADAVIWGRMNEGRRIDRDIIWHQLCSPFGIMILEFNERAYPGQPEWMDDEAYVALIDQYEAEWMPWSIYIPDPLTCSWLERGGKPTVFARRYKTLVRDLESEYTHNSGSVQPEKSLRLNSDNNFEWMSGDYERSGFMQGGSRINEVDMVWLDDGDFIYQVCLNPSGAGGHVLWSSPNPIGRPTAFIVPGNLTPAREVQNRYEPFLWPLMQQVSTLNDIRSTRATAARNLAGPHTYIPIDPELVKLYMQRGEKLPTDVRWKKNVTPYLLGPVQEVPSELSPDWDKLEGPLVEELQRYLPSQFTNVVDPAVLKAATATSILHAAEAGIRLYGPLMSAYDSAIRDIFDAIHMSVITTYDDVDLRLYANGEESARGKPLSPGSVYRFNTDAVNFPHRLMVKTRGMSQAQAAAQYDLALRQWILPDGSKGPATMDDLIDAANYTDRVAQRMKLAKEAIVSDVDPWLRQLAIQVATKKIQLDSGIDLGLLAPPGMPPGAPPTDATGMAPGGEGAAPSRIPSAAQRMDAPFVQPLEGGSAAGPPI